MTTYWLRGVTRTAES